MAHCIFCSILTGKAAGTIVYRDERVCAFLDIQPVNEGHLLVVPVAHAGGLADLAPADGARMFEVAQRLGAALREAVGCEGVNLFLADGEVAMQEVFHVHLHVLPRHRGDGFGLRFGPHYGKQPPRADLDALGERLRATLSGG